jgi:hypothetical protein
VGEDVRQPSGAVRLDAAASTPGGVVGPGAETDPDTEAARSIPPPRPRGRRWLVLLVGLVFLFTPAAAYVSGVRATEIENRRLTEFPSLSAGWEFFPQFSAWATDHLPLRDRAVGANTRLSETVFGEPPQYGGPAEGGGAGPVAPAPGDTDVQERVFPRVLQGQDGWLFLGADVSGACEPLLPLDETLAGLDRFGELVRAAGKTYVFTVAPDKSTMNPDKLPESYVGDDCAPQAKQEFWERLREDPPVGYVDLRDELERVQEEGGENLWRPSDTHWAQRGGLVYAQELADALDPALWRTSELVPTGPVELQADLAAQLGTPAHRRGARLAARARGRDGGRRARHDADRHHDRCAAVHAVDAHPRRLLHAELAVAAVAAVRLRAHRAARDGDRRPAGARVGGPVVRHRRPRDRRALGGGRRRPDHRRGLPRPARAGPRDGAADRLAATPGRACEPPHDRNAPAPQGFALGDRCTTLTDLRS